MASFGLITLPPSVSSWGPTAGVTSVPVCQALTGVPGQDTATLNLGESQANWDGLVTHLLYLCQRHSLHHFSSHPRTPMLLFLVEGKKGLFCACINKGDIPTGRDRQNESPTKSLTEHSIEVLNMLSWDILLLEIIVITFWPYWG